nr:MAG TPA: hypothetical protein [Caudoviricetes sp.]
MSLKYLNTLTKNSSKEDVERWIMTKNLELIDIDKEALFRGIDLATVPDIKESLIDVVKHNQSRFGLVEDYKLWLDLLDKYGLWEEYIGALRNIFV